MPKIASHVLVVEFESSEEAIHYEQVTGTEEISFGDYYRLPTSFILREKNILFITVGHCKGFHKSGKSVPLPHPPRALINRNARDVQLKVRGRFSQNGQNVYPIHLDESWGQILAEPMAA